MYKGKRGVATGDRRIPAEFRARVARRMQIVMSPFKKTYDTPEDFYRTVADDLGGLHPNTVRNWYDGVCLPTLMNLVRFADYFEVSIDYILGRTAVKELAHTLKEIKAA